LIPLSAEKKKEMGIKVIKISANEIQQQVQQELIYYYCVVYFDDENSAESRAVKALLKGTVLMAVMFDFSVDYYR
jgi:hypothetical protein